MGVLAAQKRDVVHAGQPNVVEEAAVALDQWDSLVGHHRRPDGLLIDEARIRHRTSSLGPRGPAIAKIAGFALWRSRGARHRQHGVDDRLVAGAATDIARQSFAYVLLG